MLHKLNQVTPESLGRLNRVVFGRPGEIRSFLERLAREDTVLRSGINRRNDPRTARIERVAADRLSLRVENFDHTGAPQIYFNCALGDTHYFFAAAPVGAPGRDRLDVELPRAIYRAERRNLYRYPPGERETAGERVTLCADAGEPVPARIVDWSLYGIGVEVPGAQGGALPRDLTVRFLDGSRKGERELATVRYSTGADAETGALRLGLALSRARRGGDVPIERRERILERPRLAGTWDRLAVASAVVTAVPGRAARRIGWPERRHEQVPVVEYENERGQTMRALVDSWGDPRGAPAIVIPPAWGRTKETLLPLAATIVETFRRAGQPVTVVRFDGTNRRGESHVDPECRAPGDEYLHFTFSQAARDIQATVDFLAASPDFAPSKVVLVTFSLAAIEGRRAVALNPGGRIAGWVSAVGMVDLQSALRSISGGIDYGYGLLQGVRFGRHELVGVLADMDRTGLDAIESQMGFLEEARNDLESIDVPITWLHGRHDAWMDVERVRDVLSCGQTENRRLLEVPTGHQLRSSRDALQTFQLIAEETSEIALGRRLAGALPPLRELERRRSAELARISTPRTDLRRFWTDYLLGRDRRLGMQLLTATSAYREFMAAQVEGLAIQPGDAVVDLGAGTGDLPLHLAASGELAPGVAIDEVDFVGEALRRGADRLAEAAPACALDVRRIVADLDVGRSERFALESERYHAVLASLLISYLAHPAVFLREVFRVLRPGGRLVLSSMRRDADVSKLYVEGLAEFETPSERARLGPDAAEHFDDLTRSFLNDASRILDMEERGRFRFWDPQELSDLVANAGFSHIATQLVFGDPPQAVVLAARRP